MERPRHPWLWALVLGLGGCTAEKAGQTPAAPTGASSAAPAASPAASSAGPDAKAPAAKGTEARQADAPSLEGPKTDATDETGNPDKLTVEEIARIKKLPEDEQAAAMAQAVCPVSGHHLGFMGVPAKTTALGRMIYLCCRGCEDEVKADPQAIIAKLEKK